MVLHGGKKRKSTGRSVGNAGCGLRVAVSARAGICVPLGAARPPRGIVGNVGVATGRLSRCGPMWARRPTPSSRSGYLISRFFAKIAGKDLFIYLFLLLMLAYPVSFAPHGKWLQCWTGRAHTGTHVYITPPPVKTKVPNAVSRGFSSSLGFQQGVRGPLGILGCTAGGSLTL